MNLVMSRTSELVAKVCGAEGVAIRINAFDLTQISSPHASIVQVLEAALKSNSNNHERIGDEFRKRPLPDGTEVSVTTLPLIHDERSLGTLAIAEQATNWGAPGASKDRAYVARLTAMLIAQSFTRLQLEVDLADANLREKQLARMAEIDQLTGLENKSSFEAKCQNRITNDDRPAALVAIDIDEFKAVNDTYGHPFGDTLLKYVAEAMRMTMPNSSILGRTGGDEFCVLLDIPDSGARRYIEEKLRNLNQAVRRTVAALGKTELGGISIGLSLYPTQAKSLKKLISFADLALYASKRNGRSTTTVYSAELENFMPPEDLRVGQGGLQF